MKKRKEPETLCYEGKNHYHRGHCGKHFHSNYVTLSLPHPQEIADDVALAYEVGADICHVHARNLKNGAPSSDLNLFREIITSIKSRGIQ